MTVAMTGACEFFSRVASRQPGWGSARQAAFSASRTDNAASERMRCHDRPKALTAGRPWPGVRTGQRPASGGKQWLSSSVAIVATRIGTSRRIRIVTGCVGVGSIPVRRVAIAVGRISVAVTVGRVAVAIAAVGLRCDRAADYGCGDAGGPPSNRCASLRLASGLPGLPLQYRQSQRWL